MLSNYSQPKRREQQQLLSVIKELPPLRPRSTHVRTPSPSGMKSPKDGTKMWVKLDYKNKKSHKWVPEKKKILNVPITLSTNRKTNENKQCHVRRMRKKNKCGQCADAVGRLLPLTTRSNRTISFSVMFSMVLSYFFVFPIVRWVRFYIPRTDY